MLQEKNAQNGSNNNTQKPNIDKTQHDLKSGRNKTEVKIKRCNEHNTTAPVDKPSSTHPSMIKNNPRIEAPGEKFLTAYNPDKVEYQHKTRPYNENRSCAEPRLRVLVDILSVENPSQIKSNPTLNLQNKKTDKKVLSAAHRNLDELKIPGTHYKDDRKPPEITPPSSEIKNTPGLIKIHLDDKFTTDGTPKTSLMINEQGLNPLNEGEKFSAVGETLKTSNRDLKVDKPSGNNSPSLKNIRLDADDNQSRQITYKLIKTVENINLPAGIRKQLNQIQSGSIRETSVRTTKDTGSQSLNNNGRSTRLTPDQNRDDKESKPSPKTTQPIISQPQGSEPEKTQTWMNYESNHQRSAREVKSESYERATKDIESGPVKKSAKVVESKPRKESRNSDSQSVKFLLQSYTEISIASDEEERKEHGVERSKAHLRPGRLKRHG